MSGRLNEGEEKDHKPHPVSIKVNNRDVTVPDRDVTGGEIKQAADVPATFKLFGPKGTRSPTISACASTTTNGSPRSPVRTSRERRGAASRRRAGRGASS